MIAVDTSPPDYGLDPFSRLSHALIRRGAKDDLDPFFLPGVLNESGQPVAIRACFYYAIAMTPKNVVLFDNWGEGGMCKLAPNEMRAVWSTEEVLAAVGLTEEELRSGSSPLPETFELPAPHEILDDLNPSTKVKESLEDPPSFDGYVGRVSLRKLLTTDMGLFSMWLDQAPDEVVERMAQVLEKKNKLGPRPG